MMAAQLVLPLAAAVPAAWRAAEQHAWRACAICTHGVDVDGQRHCRAAAVAGPARSLPVPLARANHGPCGPEAHHLVFPGLLG